jgi:MFS family permease
MDSLSGNAPPNILGPTRIRFYYGWVNVAVAAVAMVGTLPGRTQGLGLIAEPLLKDLQIDRVVFAHINLWGTLIGALFCIGFGRLIDRFGSRVVLTVVSLMLGAVVLLMSKAAGVVSLAVLITLTRGFGQSALSVVSITIVGHWFVRKLNLAMAVYTILLSVGFMAAFPIVGAVVVNSGWRLAWSGVGFALIFVLTPAAWLLVRRTPESCGLSLEGEERPDDEPQVDGRDYTLRESLATPGFWIFALSSAVYGLIASGIALFNEAILAERGFDAFTYHRSLVIVALTALVGNFLGGWLTEKWSIKNLMALAMSLLAGSLLALPYVRTQIHIAIYAVVMGLAGGFIIVIFFSFWSRTFGRRHLGRIQGAAQLLTVVASAIGPLVLAKCVEQTGSYAAVFYVMAAVVVVLAVSALLVPLPKRQLHSVSVE